MKKTSNNDALVWNLRYKNPGEGISRGPNRLLINHLHPLALARFSSGFCPWDWVGMLKFL
jgi:hypothetical protein